ncbi:MAG: flagellar basal-body MS-ring/collar protein FliF [Bacillota bacterium]
MKLFWTEVQKFITKHWQKYTRAQRIVLIGAPLLVAAVLFFLIFWASRPEYIPLFNKLTAAEAGAITAELKNLNIPYKLENDGAVIMVPKKEAAQVRLELANAGLPETSTFSFKNLDQMRLGETKEDRQLRYLLGLQNELEITIEALDGIEYARVHLVMPQPSLFVTEEKVTTAAVTIKPAYNAKIGEEHVKAIINLLSHSVEGLNPKDVTVVDTNGKVLSNVFGTNGELHGLTTNQLQLQQEVVNNIERSVQSMLDRVFGMGTTVVRANATLNFDQTKIVSETYEEGVILSKEEIRETTEGESNNGGVPGADGNTGYNIVEGNTQMSNTEKSRLTENYQPDMFQNETIVSPGQIKRLTVSVMVDADSISEYQITDIENIVASAVGLDKNRGDEIQLARFAFNKTAELERQTALDEVARQEQMMRYIQLGSGALLLLGLGLFMIIRSRRKRKSNLDQDFLAMKDKEQPVTLKEAEQLFAAQREAELKLEQEVKYKMAQKRMKTAEDIEREKIKKEVDKYVINNPDEVSRLIKTWLTEDQ